MTYQKHQHSGKPEVGRSYTFITVRGDETLESNMAAARAAAEDRSGNTSTFAIGLSVTGIVVVSILAAATIAYAARHSDQPYFAFMNQVY